MTASRNEFRREGELPPPPDPLDVEVFDSHCHLDLMSGDVDEALAAAAAVGVAAMVTVGIDVPSSEWSAATAAAHANVHATVAIHPNEAHTADDAAWAAIAALAMRPEVRAVGETGLDHFRTEREHWAQQEESFRRHVAIAKATSKALVIHDRDAHDDVLRVLADEGAPEHTVFHCFSGDETVARACADNGYVLSFAGNITFKNADDLRAAARIAPPELLLVETDAPFLTPTPYRGRPNAPYLVPLTVRTLAEVRGDDIDVLCAQISATGARVFGI